MKNVALLSVLSLSLFGAVSSFAQASPTDQSPAFGYPLPVGSGANPTRPPTTGTEGTFAPDFKGYTDPNTSPTTSGQTNPERRAPDAVGR
jgi:hypothetical protein